MRHFSAATLAGLVGVAMLAASPDAAASQSMTHHDGTNRFHAADTATLSDTAHDRKYSMPVPFRETIPGLGALYVDRTTLPVGPFLSYDHRGALMSSVYMIPLADLNVHKGFSDLKVAQELVDHVEIVFNAGHPGVPEPHYHVIIWYVSPQRAADLAK